MDQLSILIRRFAFVTFAPAWTIGMVNTSASRSGVPVWLAVGVAVIVTGWQATRLWLLIFEEELEKA